MRAIDMNREQVRAARHLDAAKALLERADQEQTHQDALERVREATGELLKAVAQLCSIDHRPGTVGR
jgi:hypothetical protein